MEFDFPSALIFPAVSLLLLLWLTKTRKPKSDLDRIPGPRRLPLIGNLHHLISLTPPPRLFREMAAKYGPLMRLQLGGVPFLIVSSVDVAKHVVKTNDVPFANRPPMHAARAITYNYTDIGFAPYGEYWRNLRKICTLELLSARRVRSFRHIREEENAGVAKWIASKEGSPANLSERVYLSSFDITSRASIGKATEEKQTLTSSIKDAMKLGGFNVADLYPSSKLLLLITGLNFRIQRVFRKTDRILDDLLSQHRSTSATTERPEDLVDVLLKYQKEETEVHLNNDKIKAVIMDMFLAGGETSATAVDWAMAEMIRNPTTLKKAQEEVRRVFDGKGYVDEEEFHELKYLKLVIKEMLRMHPPLPFLVPRMNSERCEINGYEIPANTRLLINAWAIGRDPKYWNDAEKFIPERFENSSIDFKGNNLEYIPFGAGRRMCPGMTFGLASVEFTLAMLLYHFDWKMPQGIKLDMTESFGASLKRKHDLLMIPTLKRPLRLAP
uniref:Cytochrome P450 CYP71D381 n=1 Tax=Plectranthus barbatus TaxID=41228 RepID=A0A1B0VRP2_9LAMI|nr:cytochrome P450 CYP71D381 [Plectranthus barbatus]